MLNGFAGLTNGGLIATPGGVVTPASGILVVVGLILSVEEHSNEETQSAVGNIVRLTNLTML